MDNRELNATAAQLADLTFKLLSRCLAKEEHVAKQHGLTQAEFRCLRQLNTNESINNKEIAERMNLSASRLTRIIDGLVAKGYVNREIEPNDRRNMRVYLTQQGVAFVEKLDFAYTQMHEQILCDIESGQHKPLINAMTHMLSALERLMSKDPSVIE
jgi:DNA-binding MarR family transcriptional regulator